jgi:hypothetical protein
LSKKKEMQKLQKWQERLQKNEARMAAEYAKMDKRAELYSGSRNIEKTPGAESNTPAQQASGVRNIVAELIEAQVDSSFPMPKVTARRKLHEKQAKTLEDYLRNEIDRLPFEVLNDMDERISPMQGGDMFLVEWDGDRHTHDTRGELCVRLLHPRQVVFQDGVNEIKDMDFIIVRMAMSKDHVYAKYGVSVEDESEDQPRARGGESTAEDVVTVNFGYFRNRKGGIGRYTWCGDIELEDLEDYQARRNRKCAHCGADMEGIEKCEYCGSTKAESQSSETFHLYEDMVRSDDTVVPMYETVYELPEGVEQEIMMDPFTGEAYEAMPVATRKLTEIPYYKPDVYPIVLRKNVSSWGKVLGDSDVDKIADQQNMIKKCDTRIQEKLDMGGSVLTKSVKSKMDFNDQQLKIVEVDGPDELSCFSVQNLQVSTAADENAAFSAYQQAQNILGITDSYMGRQDRTATSGTAKQIAVAQSAGRLESKRIMKNAMYADLYEVMFKFILAYSDEPRSVRHKNVDGTTTYSEFNKFDYLEKDEAGEWYWNDDFLFSVDNSSALAGNREAMWQEIRMNLQTGAFGDPSNIDTLILFWGMMANQHYPFAAEVKSQLEQKKELDQKKAEAVKEESMMGQGPELNQGAAGAMNMMGGLANEM